MKKIVLATTKYNDKYFLQFVTGFNPNFKIGPCPENDIQVLLLDSDKNILADAISHWGSYGIENQEWEVMSDLIKESVKGYLTFKEVLKYFDKKIKSLK